MVELCNELASGVGGGWISSPWWWCLAAFALAVFGVTASLLAGAALFEAPASLRVGAVAFFRAVETLLEGALALFEVEETLLAGALALFEVEETLLAGALALFEVEETLLARSFALFEALETLLAAAPALFDIFAFAACDAISLAKRRFIRLSYASVSALLARSVRPARFRSCSRRALTSSASGARSGASKTFRVLNMEYAQSAWSRILTKRPKDLPARGEPTRVATLALI